MARFYVPLDVNYQLDDKIMCAGHVAECLYVRALAYAKRAGSEGTIMHSQLRALALGLPGQPAKHAATLVGVGLWEAQGDEYYINGWLNHNLTNAQIAEQKAAMRRKSIAANHKRHHSLKGVIDDDCELCSPPTGDDKRSHVGDGKLPKEEEEKPNQDETNTKRNQSSSSSPGDLRVPVDNGHDDEMIDWLKIKDALAIAAKDITLRRPRDDAYSYERAINLDRERLEAIRMLAQDYPLLDAGALAAMHLTPPLDPSPRPVKEAWYADPTCDDCGGDGWGHDATDALVPCRCRQATEYLASVTPLRPA